MSELRPLSDRCPAPVDQVHDIARVVDCLGAPGGVGIAEFVEAAVDTLDARAASVLRLRALEGLSLRETAARLGDASPEAVRQQFRRALDRLARHHGRRARVLLGALDVALERTGGAVAVHLLPSLCGTHSVSHVRLCARIAGDDALQIYRGVLVTRRVLGALDEEIGCVREVLSAEGLARQPWSRVSRCVAEVTGLQLDVDGLAALVDAVHGWTRALDAPDEVVEVDQGRGARLASLLMEAGGPLTMQTLCARWRARYEAFEDDGASAARRKWKYRLSHAIKAAIDRHDDLWAVGPALYCHRRHVAFDVDAALAVARTWLEGSARAPARDAVLEAFETASVAARVPGLTQRAWCNAVALAASESGLVRRRRGRS